MGVAIEHQDITVLLQRWMEGDAAAGEPLFEIVYPQLRRMAGAISRGERNSPMLQPTCLITELYMRLVQQRRAQFSDRNHFFSMAARMMRRVLVDYVRYDRRLKRKYGTAVPLHEDLAWVDAASPALLDLDSALNELESIDSRKCRIVELRYFLGLSANEAAEVLGVAKATIDRDLKFARSWLGDRLEALPE
jgi:RNA polymerase sigma factor (TIGR02999 family)